jgi:hypothetical protein
VRFFSVRSCIEESVATPIGRTMYSAASRARQHNDPLGLSGGEKSSRRDVTKVAQHFSAGLAFFNVSVQIGTIELCSLSQKSGPTRYLSIVPYR